MSSEPLPPGALRLDDVTKVYDRRAGERRWRHAWPAPLPSPLAPIVAVDRLSLAIGPGEKVGIIGANGAGKSTVLKLIAGVTDPTSGRVERTGRLGAMIELGLGFHPDLTGWENVRSSAAVLGLESEETEALLPAVVAFADIGGAMDEPLKHFSTGMTARLGFALATQVPSDLLVIDEVLAVGDPEFQERCIARIHELSAAGTTLLLVSHAMWLVDSVCDRSIRLAEGTVVDDGPTREVIDRYLTPVPRTRPQSTSSRLRFTSFSVERTDLRPGEPITLRAGVAAAGPVETTDIEVAFAWASIAPDLPLALAAQRLPVDLVRDGGELVGRSDPIPTDSGHVGVRARLVDPRAGTTLDEAEAEFWIAREVVGRPPQLAVDIDWELGPLTSGPTPRTIDSTPVEGAVIARLDDVGKRFHTSKPRFDRRILPGRLGVDPGGDLLALEDVTVALGAGTTTGLIGPNGSGKTTLLRLLAGTLAPTTGTVMTRGRVVSMLELGLGFHPDLPGRENVVLTAELLGIGPRQTLDRLEAIAAFAGLGDALDAPVKQYSSGMRARLGLAVAVHTDPDLLLIDEALAVGDEQFRSRAIRAVGDLQAREVAVVFVSHDLRIVEEICDRVVKLDRGRVVADGPTDEVFAALGEPDWAGGSTRHTTAVGLGDVRVNRHRVVTGGRLEVSGEVEVTEPAPWLRLELRYRVRLDEHWEMTPEEEVAHTIFSRVLEPAGGRLRGPGWYRYRVVVSGNAIAGDVAVVVLAVDQREEEVVAESWQAVTFGNPRPGTVTPVSCPVDVTWTVVPP